MGIDGEEPVGIADALFSRVQQRVLGILFGQPERSFLSKEVIQRAKSGTGAVHRELKRLAASGLVVVDSAGWEKHYQANKDSPVFEELHSLVVKTVGLADPLRQALIPLRDRIRVSFVYGSQARGEAVAASDIDLMVISEDLTYAEVYGGLAEVEARLGRTVNPTILAPQEWRDREASASPFVETVLGQPKLFIVGDEDDLV